MSGYTSNGLMCCAWLCVCVCVRGTRKVREGGHFWYKLLDADLVVTAIGHAQTAQLLIQVAPDYVAPAVAVKSNVTWALMVAFEESLGLPFNGALLKVRVAFLYNSASSLD